MSVKVHSKRELTDTLLAGVGQVVVARHITPVATVMPHHHCTVLTRQEVAVRLAFVPVFIQLMGKKEDLRVWVWSKENFLKHVWDRKRLLNSHQIIGVPFDFLKRSKHKKSEQVWTHQQVPIRPAEVSLDGSVI